MARLILLPGSVPSSCEVAKTASFFLVEIYKMTLNQIICIFELKITSR